MADKGMFFKERKSSKDGMFFKESQSSKASKGSQPENTELENKGSLEGDDSTKEAAWENELEKIHKNVTGTAGRIGESVGKGALRFAETTGKGALRFSKKQLKNLEESSDATKAGVAAAAGGAGLLGIHAAGKAVGRGAKAVAGVKPKPGALTRALKYVKKLRGR